MEVIRYDSRGGIHDFYEAKFKEGDTYYVRIDTYIDEKPFMFSCYADAIADSREDAQIFQTNQPYSESIATSILDKDYYKFTSDITGKVMVLLQNNSDNSLQVDAEYFNSSNGLGGKIVRKNEVS